MIGAMTQPSSAGARRTRVNSHRTLAPPLLAAALAASASVAAPAVAAPPQADRAGTLITYHGTEAKATLPLRPNRLPGAPTDFRAFVKGQLHQMWDDLGHTPGCKTSPLITVNAVRTDGFALGAVNTRPRRHCHTGGGYVAFWAIRHGAWKQVIGTQEVVECSRLEKFGIPSEIGVHECYQGNQVVPYDHP
jgi:hypothetical protein